MADQGSMSNSVCEPDIHLHLGPSPKHKGRRNIDINLTHRYLRYDLNDWRSQARFMHYRSLRRSAPCDDPDDVRAHEELLCKRKQIDEELLQHEGLMAKKRQEREVTPDSWQVRSGENQGFDPNTLTAQLLQPAAATNPLVETSLAIHYILHRTFQVNSFPCWWEHRICGRSVIFRM